MDKPKYRCRYCNFSYRPRGEKIPTVCPNCGKNDTLIEEKGHLTEIIDID